MPALQKKVTNWHMRKKIWQFVGIAGTLACIVIFVRKPSFPTPDKLLVFLTFLFLSFNQGLQLLKRLWPFIALLLVYDSFRGIADHLNKHVNFNAMIRADEWLFGTLPTAKLQEWLWHGYVQWYDFVFYAPYIMHFVLPVCLVILIWKLHEKFYWRAVSMYVILSFMGFLTYLLFPAAPPWMASDLGYIQPIERVSSHVWGAMGLNDFPSFYSEISPNPVAAVPSLHAAYAALFSIIVFKVFGRKWGALSLIYPVLLSIGIVYQGEHYVVDVLLGFVYAIAAYYLTLWLFKKVDPKLNQQLTKFFRINKSGKI
jgi:membrane-associated phospholipid phosphatase